jgi:hypothetical protein
MVRASRALAMALAMAWPMAAYGQEAARAEGAPSAEREAQVDALREPADRDPDDGSEDSHEPVPNISDQAIRQLMEAPFREAEDRQLQGQEPPEVETTTSVRLPGLVAGLVLFVGSWVTAAAAGPALYEASKVTWEEVTCTGPICGSWLFGAEWCGDVDCYLVTREDYLASDDAYFWGFIPIVGPWLLATDPHIDATLPVITGVGQLAGLLTIIATRAVRPEEPAEHPVSVAVAPAPGGLMFTVGGAL